MALLVYVFASFISPQFHHHEMPAHEEHSAEGACAHEVLVWTDAEHCGHEQHVKSSHEDCFWCTHQLTLNASVNEESSRVFSASEDNSFSSTFQFLLREETFTQTNRGPPVA